jgi:hypothetical protein
MSTQLQRPERSLFVDGGPPRATPDEFAAAGSSYIAYSGRCFIDEDENALTHEMAVSFFPNWFGSGTCGSRRSIANAFSMVSR